MANEKVIPTIHKYVSSLKDTLNYQVLRYQPVSHDQEFESPAGDWLTQDNHTNRRYKLLGIHDTYEDLHHNKSGSKLYFSGEGLIVNLLQVRPARLWAELARGITQPPWLTAPTETTAGQPKVFLPIAPVLLDRRGRQRIVISDHWARVMSRFCGLNAEMLSTVLNLALFNLNRSQEPSSDSATTLRGRLEKLLHEVSSQQGGIIHDLTSRLGLLHEPGYVINHTRPANFTVEFINRQAYEKFYENQEGLNSRYRPDEVLFDPQIYLADPEKYAVIVRLIDFDYLDFDPGAAELAVKQLIHQPKMVEAYLAGSSFYYQQLGLAARNILQ